jgi:Putative beta-barrel porin-2, OmpL-like. bbp2
MYAKQSSKQRIKRAGWSLALIGSMVLSPLSSYAAVYDLNDNKDGIVGKEVKKDASETKPENKNDAAKAETKSETSRVIEMLEERVRMLEEKIAQFTGSTKAPATATATVEGAKPATGNYAVSVPAIATTPVVATTAKAETTATTTASVQDPKPDPNAGVINFFKDVEVSGIVDGYYGYNSNKVDMFTQGRAFDVRHNAFSLQLASIRLERKNSKDNPLGFRIDLGVGETVDRIISVSDSSRNDATKHVLQAYASYVAPVGTGLTLDFGKFYTPIGAEVIESKDNFNYTRGWLFTYGPYYHTGVRAKYAVNDPKTPCSKTTSKPASRAVSKSLSRRTRNSL